MKYQLVMKVAIGPQGIEPNKQIDSSVVSRWVYRSRHAKILYNL